MGKSLRKITPINEKKKKAYDVHTHGLNLYPWERYYTDIHKVSHCWNKERRCQRERARKNGQAIFKKKNQVARLKYALNLVKVGRRRTIG